MTVTKTTERNERTEGEATAVSAVQVGDLVIYYERTLSGGVRQVRAKVERVYRRPIDQVTGLPMVTVVYYQMINRWIEGEHKTGQRPIYRKFAMPCWPGKRTPNTYLLEKPRIDTEGDE